jgi:dolichol-phosphate mannosyltransferase
LVANSYNNLPTTQGLKVRDLLPHALVVIPTYNERGSIEQVLERTLRASPDLAVLVVDDGSPDGTYDIAKAYSDQDARVHVVQRGAKLGLGSAYRTGFAWGMERDFDVLCAMDADLSHDPSDLPRLIEAVESGAALAIGSRYVPGGKVNGWPRRREFLSRGGNLYMRWVTGCQTRDATSGFRAYDRSALEKIGLHTLTSEGYAFQLETALRIWEAGLHVAEEPITFTERAVGCSKINGSIIAEALWRTAVWGAQLRLRPNLGRVQKPWPQATLQGGER